MPYSRYFISSDSVIQAFVVKWMSCDTIHVHMSDNILLYSKRAETTQPRVFLLQFSNRKLIFSALVIFKNQLNIVQNHITHHENLVCFPIRLKRNDDIATLSVYSTCALFHHLFNRVISIHCTKSSSKAYLAHHQFADTKQLQSKEYANKLSWYCLKKSGQ